MVPMYILRVKLAFAQDALNQMTMNLEMESRETLVMQLVGVRELVQLAIDELEGRERS